MTPLEVFIEFDGRQLAIESDDPEAIDYFRRSYTQMIVPRVTDQIGVLSVMRTEDGYVAKGTQTVEQTGPFEWMFDWLRREVLLSFVRSRTDLLWLHAGAVELNDTALVISGTSGRGKSTLTTLLMERGWKLLSDESAPIRLDINEVIPFPQTPRRRVFPGRELSAGEFASFEFEVVAVSPHAIRREPVAISAIVFPVFEVGAPPRLDRLRSGETALELIQHSTNFVDHKAAAVERVVGLANSVPAYRVTYGNGAAAADMLADLASGPGADELE